MSLSQENEFAHEFTFVALFRVGKLGHIAFNGGFELQRLMQINGARSSKGTWVRQKWEDDIMIITDRTKDWFNGNFEEDYLFSLGGERNIRPHSVKAGDIR